MASCPAASTTPAGDPVLGPEKARIYAEAGIPEYWVVDVRQRVVVVHHGAAPEGYREIARARAGILQARDRRVPPVDLDTLLGDVLAVER